MPDVTKPPRGGEQAMQVWRKALRLRRELNWDKEKIDRYVAGSPVGVRSLSELTAMVMDDVAEKIDPGLGLSIWGAAAEGASLGFIDELAGVTAALGEFMKNRTAPNVGKLRQAYLDSRDTYREFMRTAKEAHPTATTAAEIAGGVVGGLAIPGGSAVRGVSALRAAGRAAAMGAGTGALANIGYQEGPFDPAETARAAAGGAVAGAGLSTAARWLQNIRSPGAHSIEKELAGAFPEGTNLEGALQREIDPLLAAGRESVVLGELGGQGVRNLASAGRMGPRVLESARKQAIQTGDELLGQATANTQRIGAEFESLAPLKIKSKALDNILEREHVRRLARSSEAGGALDPLAPSRQKGTFGFWHRLSGQLRERAKAEFDRLDPGSGRPVGKRGNASRLMESADDIDAVLNRWIQRLPEMRGRYSAALKAQGSIANLTGRTQRARALTKPGPGERPMDMVTDLIGQDRTEQRERGAQTIVNTLWKPISSGAEAMALVNALREGWAPVISGSLGLQRGVAEYRRSKRRRRRDRSAVGR